MNLLSWNVNGLRAVEKKGFIDWIKKESPDILCIQETKANPDQLSNDIKNIENYTSYFSSAEKKGYSGVAVYTKSLPEKVEHGFGVKEFDSEGRILILYYKDFTLINCYFPNGKSRKERLDYKMRFYAETLNFVKKTENKNIIICGDVNTAHKEIDLARPKENSDKSGFLPIEREWIDTLLENDFIDSFREFNKEKDNYSWWDYKTRARSRNVGWRIDYFFVSKKLKNKLNNAFILKEVMGSDHCPVGIDIF